jgi:hypothetical protein
MRFYTKQHLFYCGVDLHTRSMYICVLDQSGQILLLGVCVGQQQPAPTSEKPSPAVKS